MKIFLIFLQLFTYSFLHFHLVFPQNYLVNKPIQKNEANLNPNIISLGHEDRRPAIHNGNNVETIFFNFGGIGNWYADDERTHSGIYPKGSGHSYIGEIFFMAGAEVVDAGGVTRHIFSDGSGPIGGDISPQGYQWCFEPVPGYFNPDNNSIAMSHDPATWPTSWPNHFSDWSGFWNGEFCKYPRTNQESYFVMNDYVNDEFLFYPFPNDTTKRGLGFEVEVRGYQSLALPNVIFWTYLTKNMSAYNYEKVVLGCYADPDIGESFDNKDDWCTFIDSLGLAIFYDNDGWTLADGGYSTGYFGIKLLESPGNPYDHVDNDQDGFIDESQYDGIDNDSDWDSNLDDIGSDGIGYEDIYYSGPDADGSEGNGLPDLGEPNFEWTDKDESDQIGLTSFKADSWRNTIQISSDEQMWTIANSGFSNFVGFVDIVSWLGSGPFPLKPQEKTKIAFAMVFGKDVEEIIHSSKNAQSFYNGNFKNINFNAPPIVSILYPSSDNYLKGLVKIQWNAWDFNKDSLWVDIFYSLNDGFSWNLLSVGEINDGVYEWDTTILPNANSVKVKIIVYDGVYSNEVTSQTLTISNYHPALPDSLVRHIAGIGTGTVLSYIVDESALTGHTYQLTFNDTSGLQKTYNVFDLANQTFILEGATELNNDIEGPEFDGIRLLINDFKELEPDTVRSGWLEGDCQFDFDIKLYPNNPVPTTADYKIIFFDKPMKKSVNNKWANCIVLNETENDTANFVFGDTNNDSMVTHGDQITPVTYVSNHARGTWLVTFYALNPTDAPPGSKDVFYITVNKPFTHEDIFIINTHITNLNLNVDQSIKPKQYKLYQNYPNPFNSNTKIDFAIPHKVKATIKIYDILGREVIELSDKFYEPGWYSIQWNGEDKFGCNVASGLYFYQLKADKMMLNKKCLFLK